MRKISLERVVTFAVAGAAGGLLTWLVLNPSMSALEQARMTGMMPRLDIQAAAVDTIGEALRLGAMLGLTIGVALIAVEESKTRNLRRLALYCALGALAGVICGMIGSIGGQIVFSALLGGASLMGRPDPVIMVTARTIGWALIGGAAGICPGVVSRSRRRIVQGMVGGLAGGAAGGLCFDLIANITQSGSTSRLLGFVLIGLLVGALVSLVEEFAKEYWLTALTGAREGRAYILARADTLVGRNELADIPLFGDTSVQRRHAHLLKSAGGVTLAAEPGLSVTVNNQVIGSVPLADGDVIGVGTHRLRFGSRRATAAPVATAPEGAPRQSGPMTTPIPASASDVVLSQSVTLSRLDAVAGPYAGASFTLTPGTIIGRDPRCDIALTNDTLASRQHARFVLEPTGWRVEDGGSTNGLWVNGQRVVSHVLQPGDLIGIGQSQLRVG